MYSSVYVPWSNAVDSSVNVLYLSAVDTSIGISCEIVWSSANFPFVIVEYDSVVALCSSWEVSPCLKLVIVSLSFSVFSSISKLISGRNRVMIGVMYYV